ncbi:MAG: hypothetical protein HC875_05990 [Anaerolineales bacterium]|nr:hypothetical protein [Anaerolineales bacterium]
MPTNKPALRFLQQENVWLQEENKALQAGNGSTSRAIPLPKPIWRQR